MARKWGKPAAISAGVLALVCLSVGAVFVTDGLQRWSKKKKLIGRWQPVAHRLAGMEWEETKRFIVFMEFREDGTLWEIHKDGREGSVGLVELSDDRMKVKSTPPYIFTWGFDEDGDLVLTALTAAAGGEWSSGKFRRVEIGEH